MAGRIAHFIKDAWAKEPVLVASFAIGGVSAFCGTMSSALLLPFISPFTKYAIMINEVTPYTYPVPVRDDGNMPDVPSHPQDPQGRSLEWLKNL